MQQQFSTPKRQTSSFKLALGYTCTCLLIYPTYPVYLSIYIFICLSPVYVYTSVSFVPVPVP